MAGESRGSIAFFATYRPPVPLDVFSCPVAPPPSSPRDELHLTDGVSYNHSCRPIPAAALRALLQRPKLASEATTADVDAGRITGLVFVSERDSGLETLHVALRFDGGKQVKVFGLADIFGAGGDFSGVRMEDSGCFGGGYRERGRAVDHTLVYVSTREPVAARRSPWTVVYGTNLRTGETARLTPRGTFDLSPAVSPSGKRVAVASWQGKPGLWDGEIEDLRTDIYVMNVHKPPLGRTGPVVKNAGWPTWGSDDVIFFHRRVGTTWGVFRFSMSTGEEARVTPEEFDAVTPAAISETKVAVATIRRKSQFSDVRVEEQYRHIEIFDVASPEQPVKITQKTRPKTDHFNPFVLDGGSRIGSTGARASSFTRITVEARSSVANNFHKLQSPHKDVGLFRVSGVCPTISKDGSKLAFVDNEFKAVWLADSHGLRVVYEKKGPNSVFSTAWNQNTALDTLYVCVGPSFSADKPLQIYAIHDVSALGGRQQRRLTAGASNNAFPSSSPDGGRLVFRSTRDGGGGGRRHKNLYVMEDAAVGEFGTSKVTRLTSGAWTDTHCSWSPREGSDWIVFSSTRDKPAAAPADDNGLDPGYFAVFLVRASDPTVVVRVVRSADSVAGHVNHPVFSPDGRSIAVTADLAAVSADPISLPLFLHSVRPYGDIFTVDIDPDDISKNRDVRAFHRVTHSRYENSTPAWTTFATDDPNAQWSTLVTTKEAAAYRPACPYAHPDGGDSWHMTGHLLLPKRCC
ncbi:hypothetical protein OsJ_11196 [Oryza sativa Japonica Group]|uniref:Uncharacterized protein n=1 Tax=Oryza sativa subsp. japonica TaxID=39947 RepID=A3AIX0_ORYSJ|nr:hypothetical protein OsJ_11196 [Oryza sativa Japonica Group]